MVFVFGVIRDGGAAPSFEPVVVDGGPAFVISVNGEVDGVLSIHVADGRITGLYYVRNPEKLTHIVSATTLSLR
ncbi:hypothetical protein IU449_25700 [Nocardia higoensis]|uniref:Uncharacterized protein n=1 Tax=Nocardia higoensis TaxID=228599 RepID=A0ABS0DHF8_9NOCA|nr:hypothetical protein [Nocardia higoensis]MBF6357897.1 hypothetical protein [Nocardia higoensis]